MVNLHLGDCLDILPTLTDNSVDLVLVDLPYGTTACKWDSIIPLDKLWEQYNRICKEDGAMVFTAAQPFTTILAASNLERFRYEWIWEKPQGTNPMNAKVMPLKSHENILVFYRKKPVYNPQMWYSTPYSGFSSNTSKIGEVYGNAQSKHRDNPDGSRYPKTILKFKQEKGLHPTQKPVALMEYLIRTYSNEGETILDNCMGSGTTGVACMNTNRNFIGIEMDENYYKIAEERIKNAVPVQEVAQDPSTPLLDALY
jgi:site-specific DNA-methyltransferase (adenine-specific)